MKKFQGLASALCLVSCTGYQMPPATPLPSDIQTLSATIVAINISPVDYLTYGTALATQKCIGWFGQQIAGAAQNSMLATELGLLGTAAGVAGGPAGAGAAAATGFGAATVGNLQANAPGGIDPVVTYGLVRKVQQAWLAAVASPITKADAYMLVEDYAEKCQLPDIKRAIADAVTSAPVRAVVGSNATMMMAPSVSSVPRSSEVVRPPVIIVGQP